MGGIDLIIFDCDGVLVDTEALSSRVLAQAIAPLGWAPDWRELERRFTGLMMADIVAAIEGETGRPVPSGWVVAYRESLSRAFADGVEAIPGVADLLQGLSLPFCVASNGSRPKMHQTLGSAGLLPHFEQRMFSAYDVACGKPAPDLFLHAAAAMGVEPSRCLVVEDSVAGLHAALAAAMQVACYSPSRPPPEGLPGPVHHLRAMREISGLLP